MSEPGFTKGPWVARWDIRGTATRWFIGLPGHGPSDDLAQIYRPPQSADGTAEANAHLIAAAPDLYEALKVVMREYGYLMGSDAEAKDARAALRKARGQ